MRATPDQATAITRRRLLASATGAAVLAAPAVISRAALGASAFPRTTWPQVSPRSVGMSVDKLLEAKAAAKRYGTGAGCVIRHGLVVFRWGDFDQRFLIQSATKSWGSVLLEVSQPRAPCFKLALHTRRPDVPGLMKVVSKGNYVAVVCEREEQAIRAAVAEHGLRARPVARDEARGGVAFGGCGLAIGPPLSRETSWAPAVRHPVSADGINGVTQLSGIPFLAHTFRAPHEDGQKTPSGGPVRVDKW